MRERVNSPDYVFLSLVGVLVVFGLIVLASASSVIAYEKFGSSFYLTGHQLLFGLLPGLIFFFIAMRMPYPLWRKWALPIFVLTIALLIAVLIPGIGRRLGGARSWFTIGAVSFQPSEVVKIGLILYLAAWLERYRDRLGMLREGYLPLLGIVAVPLILVVLQPDVGTVGIIGALALFIAFIAGARLSHLGAAVGVGVVALLALIKIAPYRVARLTSFAHPEFDPQGIGYQINQALLAVGSGGWFGQGFGQSRQKFRYLPEVTGDSIFPIIAEELGFLVSAAFVVLTVILLWRMMRIASRAPDEFSKYVVLGIAGWFGIQSFVNIGSMLGILPLTGLPLPFVSYGGTALASELVAVGIVGSISRHAR